MGIVNVTPDSFSDGGHFFDTAAAIAHATQLVADGADLIDIGGESTRPGSQPVSEQEELDRVLPVVEAVCRQVAVPVSIDTSKAEALPGVKAVVTGFLAGAAIDVVIGELPKLTGTDAEGKNAWRELGSWAGSLDDTHGTTLLVGLVSLAVILGLRWVAPAVPGALVLVVGGLLASGVFDLGAHVVALVGTVPRGLPTPQLPDGHVFTDHAVTIAAAAFALLLIGFSQTAGDARTFATRHRYQIDVDQESVAQGMANVGAGVFQGMPVSTSLSASSLNEAAGARSAMASLATGGFVILTLVALYLLAVAIPPVIRWAFVDAIWTAPSGQACRSAMGEADGACWAFIGEKLRFILFGRFPYAEQWRPFLVVLIFVALILLSCDRRLWGRRLPLLWLVGLAAVGTLMWGGVFGLAYVENGRWGGLALTLLLATMIALPRIIGDKT
jgi:hypothetical protein